MLGTDNLKKIHLVGVGGAGMSGIAEILINMDLRNLNLSNPI